MMNLTKNFLYLTCLLILICNAASFTMRKSKHASECRFAKSYTTEQLISNKSMLSSFLSEVIEWQTKFIKQVGIDKRSGLTYDGSRLDVDTGELLPKGLHEFTASSKESIHIGVLAKVLQGAQYSDLIYSVKDAFAAIELKVNALQDFNRRYPGFGGYLPWVFLNGSTVEPTWDFKDRVPALDNGEMFWACLALSVVWSKEYPNVFPQIRQRWDNITWKIMIKNSRKIFFNQTTKKIRAVASITNISAPVHQNNYTNPDNYYLDDPYEGQLYAWIITLFAKDQFTAQEINNIWIDKRKKLQSVEYNLKNKVDGSITVERGCWFSSHQQWKNLFMPYYLSPTYKKIQHNSEKVRTIHSVQNNIPGMYASVSGPASTNYEDTGYFSDAGIQEIAFNSITFDKIVTPYSSFPVFLVSKEHGAAWLHNMLVSPCGQTKYGALEGTGLNGSLISPMMTWDTKITTVLAIMNGTTNIIQKYLSQKGLLKEFVDRIELEYAKAFPIINGLNISLAIPKTTILSGRKDFSTCQSS